MVDVYHDECFGGLMIEGVWVELGIAGLVLV